MKPIDKTDSVLVVPQTINTSAAEDEVTKQPTIAENSFTDSKIRITKPFKETRMHSFQISVDDLE